MEYKIKVFNYIIWKAKIKIEDRKVDMVRNKK